MKEPTYRLLIVDDDKEVREGLSKIVNWKSCGFQVVAALKDGEEGIQYLEQHQVDVVLSDIMMPFVSGLGLAKHIYERKIPAKVVLISGYQEFGLAKEALRYNVQDYLLKPTDLDELYGVFKSLKEQLDLERLHQIQLMQDKEQWGLMMRYLKERYIPHLLIDALADDEEIQRQFEMIGLHVDPRDCECIAAQITLPQGTPIEYVQRTLLHQLTDESAALTLLPLGSMGNTIHVLAISTSFQKEEFVSQVEAVLKHASTSLITLTGLSIEWKIHKVYETLIQFLEEARSSASRSNTLPPSKHQQWKLDKQEWVEYLENEQFEEAERLLEKLFISFAGEEIDFMKSLLIQLFGSLDIVYATESGSSRLMELCKSQNREEIRQISSSLLHDVRHRYKRSSDETERKVITQAKQYVKDSLGKDISLSEVAEQVYLNPVYLSRLFKQETGGSFSEYVTKVRMKKASDLLRNTNMKIYEICEQAGYKDLRHFYKLFKNYTGLPPSEYRERKV